MQSLESGDLHTTVPGRFVFGQDFMATVYLAMRAGHWCPSCQAPPWESDRRAAVNPFFAQVWSVKDTASTERRNGGVEPAQGPAPPLLEMIRLYSSRWSGPL